MRQQAQMQQQNAASQSAVDRGLADAQQGTIDMDQLGQSDIIEEFSEPSISKDAGEFDDLDEFLAAEFGKHIAFGNISPEEYSEQRLKDRARARFAKMEFARTGRIGSKCTGDIRAIMVPEEDDRPPLSDEMSRHIDAAFEERSMMRSLSKEAKGFRGVTEAIVQTFTRTDSDDDSGSSGGFLRRLFR